MNKFLITVLISAFSFGIALSQCDTLSVFPIVYDLESENTCLASCTSPCILTGPWTNLTIDDTDWIVDEDGTTSVSTGPLVDNTLGTSIGNYLYLESSSPCFPSKEAILESSCFDLSLLNSPTLKFSYHMMGATMGDLFVEISTGGPWINLFSLLGQQQTNQTDPWLTEEIDLSSYTGVIQLRFRGITTTSYTSDIALDDIIVFDKPPTDVGIIAISSPLSGYSLTCSEVLSVKLKNFGTNSQDTIPVAFSINGNAPFRDTIYTNLASDNEMDFSFPVAIDLTQFGTFSFDAWSELPGDMVFDNDSVEDYLVLNDSSVVLGIGESVNGVFAYPAPYGNSYTCSRHQMIIRASELEGYSAGNINGLGFNVKTPNGAMLQDFEIKMKLTSDSVVVSNFDNSGLATVWGPQNYSDVSGWNMHSIGGGFYWDGISNILIETCFCNGVNNYTNNAEMYYTNTGFLSTIFQYIDNDSNHCVNASVGVTVYERPDIRLDLEQPLPPETSFSSSQLISCLGGAIQFFDSSEQFPTCWYWDFGDGNTDTVQNPIHLYTDTGLFTITLVAYNNNGTDTATYVNYIDIRNGAGPANCKPTITDSINNLGIQNVQFNTIANSTTNVNEGYSDYSCSVFTTLLTGSLQSLHVETGPLWEEDVRVWIDYNSDGFFDTTEIILSSDNVLQNHTVEFFVPQSVDTDTMLRMRVMSDYAGLMDGTACDTLTYGQTEDYGVIVQDFNTPPIPEYHYTIIDPCLGTVSFSDYSQFYPSSLIWDFGDGASASGPNVTHTFGTGVFDVSLIATNGFGSDTIMKTITIDSVVSDFTLPEDTIDIDILHLYINTSYGANSWQWDFGDGGNSNNEFPYHSYSSPGIYQISLLATNTNTGCVDSITKSIVVIGPIVTSISDHIYALQIAPNPTSGLVTIKYGSDFFGEYKLTLKDVLGKDVFVKKFKANKSGHIELDFSVLPKGVYLLTLNALNQLNNDQYKTFNTYKIIVE